jgi:mersacidin/lichenicidin family type 2 lantibiotic
MVFVKEKATVNETVINDFEINQYLKEGAMSHLNTIDIIRAWKDPEYRLSLSEAERALLPGHPAGFMELTDIE